MAETTNIAWTDSTFNPWWGCTKIAPGCDNCYAHDLDKRTGGNHWGNGSPRLMSEDNWKKPVKWNKAAKLSGIRHKVFCGSMCDWADNNASIEERERLWNLIKATPMLDWQLLTKRASNISKYLPSDWGDGYGNVWLGVTVEDNKHGLKRIEYLSEIPTFIRFLSIEPLLEDLEPLKLSERGIDWVIVGGESGHKARPMELAWVENIIEQCRLNNVPLFFKQWGGKKDKGGCLINGIEIKEFPL